MDLLNVLSGFASPEDTPNRNMFTEGGWSLANQSDLAPSLFSTNAAYQQQYSGAAARNFNDILMGAPAHDETFQYFNPKSGWESKTIGIKSSPGLMNTYGQMQRAGVTATKQSNPAMARLLAMFQQQAQQEMADPYHLTEAERRQLVNESMSNPALSMFGAQPRDAYAAYSSLGSAGEARAAQRRTFAGNVMGMQNEYVNKPAQSWANTAMNLGLYNSMNAQPTLFDPWSNYTSDVNNTNFNAKAAANIAAANNRAAITAAIIGAGSKAAMA